MAYTSFENLEGSAAELRTQIYICRRIDVLSEELHRDLVKDCISI
ncbi:MAG: four helix bundle protein, partial [Deltaproteobacteria bacterium]|nr:four helix bundle protein [Deltaproteobacteria bacterium]